MLRIDRAQKCFDILFGDVSTSIDVKKAKGVDQMALNVTGLRFHLLVNSFSHVSSDEFSVLNPIIMVKVNGFENVSYLLNLITCLIIIKVMAELLKVDVPVLIGVYFDENLPQLFVACVTDFIGEINHNHFAQERPIVYIPHVHEHLLPQLFGSWLHNHLAYKSLKPRMSKYLLGPNSPSLVFVQHFGHQILCFW